MTNISDKSYRENQKR